MLWVCVTSSFAHRCVGWVGFFVFSSPWERIADGGRYGAVSRPDLQRRFPELDPVTLKEVLSRIAELDTLNRRWVGWLAGLN